MFTEQVFLVYDTKGGFDCLRRIQVLDVEWSILDTTFTLIVGCAIVIYSSWLEASKNLKDTIYTSDECFNQV